MTQNCEHCKGEIRCSGKARRRFCSQKCSREATLLVIRELHPGSASGVPTGTVGALAELLVSADLLNRGYEVFRALSPSCSCDLVAVRGQYILRIEVKNAHRTPAGICFNVRFDPEKADVLALYDRLTNNIHYTPDIKKEPWVKSA